MKYHKQILFDPQTETNNGCFPLFIRWSIQNIADKKMNTLEFVIKITYFTQWIIKFQIYIANLEISSYNV